MKIKTIKFCKENIIKNIYRFIFIGRSNVGKSSLINLLTNNNKISKVSSNPGKTKDINHFIINNNLYFVDMPGYGYNNLSKKYKIKFYNRIIQYTLKNKNLSNIFLLLDIRRVPVQINDINFIKWLELNELNFCIIFTKIDKVNINLCNKNIEVYKKIISKEIKKIPFLFKISIFKNYKKDNKKEILKYIYKTIKYPIN